MASPNDYLRQVKAILGATGKGKAVATFQWNSVVEAQATLESIRQKQKRLQSLRETVVAEITSACDRYDTKIASTHSGYLSKILFGTSRSKSLREKNHTIQQYNAVEKIIDDAVSDLDTLKDHVSNWLTDNQESEKIPRPAKQVPKKGWIQAVEHWRSTWPAKLAKQSNWPIGFWETVADELLDGRIKQDNNAIVPIGRYADHWPGSLNFLVTRNNIGIQREKDGNIDGAIFLYEVSVADEFCGTHPYDRLRILYTKKKWYKDAIRVCRVYIDLPDRPNGQAKERFQHHLEKLIQKLECEGG